MRERERKEDAQTLDASDLHPEVQVLGEVEKKRHDGAPGLNKLHERLRCRKKLSKWSPKP